MARTQRNKATERHLGTLKAKLAQYKRELLLPKGSSGGAGEGELSNPPNPPFHRKNNISDSIHLPFHCACSIMDLIISGFDVTKSGDARVGLIGFPSVGKSTLLTKLTGAFSEVASYEFTTLTCVPGGFFQSMQRVE